MLPAPIRIPMGGAKVVYTHAAGLAARGHAVTVVAPRQPVAWPLGVLRRMAVALRDTVHGVRGDLAYDAPAVTSLLVSRVTPSSMPGGDVVIATGVQTAPWVHALHERQGVGVYFVQGDERFVTPGARDTWHLGMPLLTCAEWLRDEMRASGLDPLAVIPNAVDPKDFGLDVPIDDRPLRVVALYHRHPVKGPDVLIRAIQVLQAAVPEVAVTVFSARPPSHRLPAGVELLVRPEPAVLRSLYNHSSVVLHTSRSEGWGLVPMEAAACGCAVVASASRGVSEYLQDGVSMRAVPVGDGVALGQAALAVLRDPGERVRLGRAAHRAVAQFGWDESTAILESALRTVTRAA